MHALVRVARKANSEFKPLKLAIKRPVVSNYLLEMFNSCLIDPRLFDLEEVVPPNALTRHVLNLNKIILSCVLPHVPLSVRGRG